MVHLEVPREDIITGPIALPGCLWDPGCVPTTSTATAFHEETMVGYPFDLPSFPR